MSAADAAMTTFEAEDGGEVCGEFSFVVGTEWFDDLDEPVRLIRRRWVCVEEQVGTYYSTSAGLLCSACQDEPTVPRCEHCAGTGEDPMRGAGWVPDPEPLSAVHTPPAVPYCGTCGQTAGHWAGCDSTT